MLINLKVLASTTVTETETITTQATATNPAFLLHAQGGNTDYGRRGLVGGRGDSRNVILDPVRSSSTPFRFDDQCGLALTANLLTEGWTAYGKANRIVMMLKPGSEPDPGYEKMICTSSGDNQLICSIPGGASINNACPAGLEVAWFLSTEPMQGCTQFTFAQE